MKELDKVSSNYALGDFKADELKAHIQADIALLEKMYARVAPIKPEHDAKLQAFLAQMRGPLKNRKVLVFTSYVDTANYIFANGIQAADTDVVDIGFRCVDVLE